MATTIVRSTDSAAVSAGAVLNGNAGSLISVLDHALVTRLGWTKDFTATNKGVYRAPAGVRHYLDVDDSAPDATAQGRNARVRGYEVATAVGTGTGPFPTVLQAGVAVYVKSSAVGTTARPWIVIGDDRTFYLFSSSNIADPPNLSTHTWNDGFYFGEIYSFVVGDNYKTLISWGSGVSSTSSPPQFPGTIPTAYNSSTAASYAMARAYLGTGAAEWVTPLGLTFFNSNTIYCQATSVAFPNLADGGLYLSAATIGGRGAGTSPTGVTYIRGRLRGLYMSGHFATGINDQDTISGLGDFAGKTFMIIHCASNRGSILAFETTSWASSS